MSIRTTRAAALLGATGVTLVLAAAPAAAHISPDKTEVPAGGFTSLTFTVPHGCEESPTTAIAIQVPEGVLNAAPQVHPGWSIEVEQEALAEPVEEEGEEPVTERPGVITFTADAGNALPSDYRDAFTVGFQAPDAAGETLYWKIIQTCEEGETAWIEEYDGEGEEPEHPAPSVLIAASEGDGHGGGATEDDEVDEVDEVGTEVAATPASSSDGDDDGAMGIAIGGLVVGALGLATGGAALAKGRRTGA